MRCVWCDRPSIRPLRPGVQVNGDSCNQCDEQLPHDHVTADPCLRCEQPQDLLKVIGQQRSASDVVEQLAQDHRLYLATGGGITLSGGEPLYQPTFAKTVLQAAKHRGWHTAIDTSGQVSTAIFEEALPLTDLVIFDLKETDLQLHQRWTGTQLEPVVRNLVRAAVSNSELWVRLPVVPFANDRDDHWEQAGDLLAGLPGPPSVHLMPYYFGGHGMVRAVDADSSGRLVGPSEERLQEIVTTLQGYGLDVNRP
jgi:pyruvate formate lyase activating enzyme